MLIKNIDSMPQNKLKKLNFWVNALYLTLTFIGPIVSILLMTFKSGDVKQVWRIPIITLIIIVCILAAAVIFLKKRILKINVLNIDGTYNEKMRGFKHIMLFISSVFFPIMMLIITGIFATFMKDCIDFYMRVIMITLSFIIAGMAIDKLIISELDEELAIRNQLATQNSIELRKNNLMK